MFLRRAALLLLIVAVLSSFAAAKPSTTKNKDDFKACGGAKKCLGVARLERIRRRSGVDHKSVDAIAAQIDEDGDLGVDDLSDMLIYACAGMLPAASAADGQVAAAALEPTYATATPEGIAEPAPLHHHHHHKHLLQVDPTTLSVAQGEIVSGWAPDVPDTPIDVVSAFKLHSRPSAVKKILLDFDGHTTSNTQWNVGRAAALITPPYDKDGSPTTWSASELSDILAIWRAVSEDYAPWDVDVTTEDPGAAYLGVNGIRAAIGGAFGDWYGNSAGGVAYVGSFAKSNGYYSPAFIFATSLYNDRKNIAEATAHEIGHTLGLSHDGVVGGSGYYTGTANGLWAPIMGAGYYCSMTQFSKGEYLNANNLEDDMAVISTRLGSVYSWADEQGSTIATASPFSTVTPNAGGVTVTGAGYGIIRAPDDIDMYTFTTTAAGTVTFTLTVAPGARSDLAATVSLLDPTGTTVLIAATGSGLSSQFAVPAAGQYYLSVQAAGLNEPVSTGFSTYASRGQYKLTAVFPGAAVIQPASPSPAPVTPSPSPQPPSPSPQPPSPSPSPAPPSPSPSPAPPAAMTISTVTNEKVGTACNAQIRVVRTSDGATLDSAVVTGTWYSVLTRAGWPYPASAATGATGVTGVASTTSKTLPGKRGNGCWFVVSSIQLPGYFVDPSLSLPLQTSTVKW